MSDVLRPTRSARRALPVVGARLAELARVNCSSRMHPASSLRPGTGRAFCDPPRVRANPASVLALATCIALSLAACGGDDAAAPGREQSAAGRVGLVIPSATHPAHQEFERTLRKGLKDEKEELAVQPSNGDAARAADLLRTFTSQRARAIVVAPGDTVSLRAAIDAAATARVPVFTVDLPVPGSRTTTHVEPDHHAAGGAAAAYLGTFLGDRGRTTIVGRLGWHGTREAEAGYRTTMNRFTGRVVTAPLATDGTRAGAAARVTALLGADRDLDGIFALDPETALGAMDAAFASRRADLVIVSFGATQPVLDAVRDERPIRAAVLPRPEEAARRLAETIAKHLGDEPVTPILKVPVRLVNVDSVKR